MYQEIWSMSVSTHTDTHTLINYTPLAKAPHPCWTTSTRQPTYDANPGVHVGIKTDVGEEDLVGAVVEQHLVQLQDGWRQLVHLWEPVTRSAQKQALSHIVHKNRHCHTSCTKTGIVTCSTQNQVLSHAAHKSRHCHSVHKNRHCHTSCTKTGIVTCSTQNQVLSHAAHKSRHCHSVHKNRHCHTSCTKTGIVTCSTQNQVLSHAAHKSRHCHSVHKNRHSGCGAARWVVQTLCSGNRAPGLNQDSHRHILPYTLVVDYVSNPSRSRGCRFKSEFRHSLSLPCLASRWWTTCPALHDQEGAGSNPNSDTHFLSLALPQGGELRVQPFKIKRLQVQIRIQTLTFSPLPCLKVVDYVSSPSRSRSCRYKSKFPFFPSPWQWIKHPALQDQEV